MLNLPVKRTTSIAAPSAISMTPTYPYPTARWRGSPLGRQNWTMPKAMARAASTVWMAPGSVRLNTILLPPVCAQSDAGAAGTGSPQHRPNLHHLASTISRPYNGRGARGVTNVQMEARRRARDSRLVARSQHSADAGHGSQG